MASNNTSSFVQERDKVISKMNQQSVTLRHHPERYLEIAEAMDQNVQQIETMKAAGDPEDQSRCFRVKCNAITTTLQDHSELLKNHPGRFLEIATVIDMAQLQLGRLTVTGDNGNDDFAQHMDTLAGQMADSWQPTDTDEEKQARVKRSLQEAWCRLHLDTVSGCECVRCKDVAESVD